MSSLGRFGARRVLVIGAAVSLGAGVGSAMIAPAASAASTSNNRPAIVMAPVTVDGTSATVTYKINRGGKQVAPSGLTCSLTGPTPSTTTSASCGTVTTAQGMTSSTVKLTGLQSGSYTYTVNLLLTDGGTARATSRSFDVVGSGGMAACLNSGLTNPVFTPNVDGGLWTCTGTGTLVQFSPVGQALNTACIADAAPAQGSLAADFRTGNPMYFRCYIP